MCQAHLSTYGSLTRTNKENNLHKLTWQFKHLRLRRTYKKFTKIDSLKGTPKTAKIHIPL